MRPSGATPPRAGRNGSVETCVAKTP